MTQECRASVKADDLMSEKEDSGDQPSPTIRPEPASKWSVALLDAAGVIVETNDVWERFCSDNGGELARCGVGASYLAACDGVPLDADAARTGLAIRAALRGDLVAPLVVRLACHSPKRERWFDVLIASRRDDQGGCVGASVSLLPATRSWVAGAQDLPRADVSRFLISRTAVSITQNEHLSDSLQQIADTARDLTGAHFAAVGVVNKAGSVTEHASSAVESFALCSWDSSRSPEQALTTLLQLSRPLWVPSVQDHPHGHFLRTQSTERSGLISLPVTFRGQWIGTLIVIGAGLRPNASHDLTELSQIAGTTIERFSRLSDSLRRERWQDAAARTLRHMGLEIGVSALGTVLRHAALAGGAVVAVAAVDTLEAVALISATHGPSVEDRLGQSLFGDDNRMYERLRSGRGICVAPDTGLLESYWWPGSWMAAPIVVQGKSMGVIAVGRAVGDTGFDEDDLDQLHGFAALLPVAWRLDDAERDRNRLTLAQRRDRLIDALHEGVLQELSAVRATLQSAGSSAEPALSRVRLMSATQSLDTVGQKLRLGIAERRLVEIGASSLGHRFLTIIDEELVGLGFTLDVSFVGLLDEPVPSRVSDDVVAALVEALSNVARHADATAVEVRLTIGNHDIRLAVTDNGRGLTDAASSERGWSTLRLLAAGNFGAFTVGPAPDGGCQLVWTARF